MSRFAALLITSLLVVIMPALTQAGEPYDRLQPWVLEHALIYNADTIGVDTLDLTGLVYALDIMSESDSLLYVSFATPSTDSTMSDSLVIAAGGTLSLYPPVAGTFAGWRYLYMVGRDSINAGNIVRILCWGDKD